MSILLVKAFHCISNSTSLWTFLMLAWDFPEIPTRYHVFSIPYRFRLLSICYFIVQENAIKSTLWNWVHYSTLMLSSIVDCLDSVNYWIMLFVLRQSLTHKRISTKSKCAKLWSFFWLSPPNRCNQRATILL